MNYFKHTLSTFANNFSRYSEQNSKRRMIVLAGPDRVGKTTFSEKLEEELNLNGLSTKYVHFSAPDKERQKTHGYQYQYTDLLTEHTSNVVLILDRSWICGLVYDVCRRNRGLNIDGLLELEEWIARQPVEVTVLAVYADWCDVENGHIEELEAGISPVDCIERARDEHFEYYRIVQQYAEKSGLKFGTVRRQLPLAPFGLGPSGQLVNLGNQRPSSDQLHLSDLQYSITQGLTW